MKEDVFVESRVKAALEDGPALSDRRVRAVLFAAARASRRRRVRRVLFRWGGPVLLAASLALVLILRVPTPAAETSGLADAIGLLREMDGVAGEGRSDVTTGELLLAWQEAPCVDLLSADELL